MKNSQKGSIVSILIIIIVLLLIVGGIYVYETQQLLSPTVVGTGTQLPIENQQVPVQTSSAPSSNGSSNIPPANLSGGQTAAQAAPTAMQQYSDPEVGFSFWYPGNWQVTREAPNQDSDSNITQGTVLATLLIGPIDASGNTNPQISIQEVNSPASSITDNAGTDMNPTYYFNFSAHTWMTIPHGNNNMPGYATAANVSNNTMGGLHMLGASGQNGTATIIPLSAQVFLVVNQIGSFDATLLAKTVLALDPAVATPWSAALQTQTIQAESAAYGAQPGVTWKTYNDPQLGITFQYPGSFGNSNASLQETNGVPQVLITPTGANIDESGCYQGPDTLGPQGYSVGSQVTVNNIPFCLSTGSDVGAGQLYHSYFYTTHHNGEYVTIGYTVHTSNGCGPYEGGPAYISCSYLLQNYDTIVTPAIQKSVGTLTFAR